MTDILLQVLCTVERDYVDDESCTRANSVPESAQSVRFNEVRNERLREERRRDKALRKGTAFFLQRVGIGFCLVSIGPLFKAHTEIIE